MKKNVLVTSRNIGEDNLRRLSKVANVFASWKLNDRGIERILPKVDVLVVLLWPEFLTAKRLARMKRLRFLQSVLVGVNHVPFHSLGKDVMVASNSGAYSLEVGEHAWALLLTAAKRVVEHHLRVRGGAKSLSEFSGEAAGIVVLEGKMLGIVGYGGIGMSFAGFGKAFGMKVMAFSRSSKKEKGVRFLSGKKGLDSLLKQSDVVLLSLPLTKSTYGLIGEGELSLMKENAILVNIARGDLVDQRALYTHLTEHPNFRYATDVWWYKEGQETLEADHPFTTLSGFVGTPHMSGPVGIASGRPGKLAADNVMRYLRGETPKHMIDRTDYAGFA